MTNLSQGKKRIFCLNNSTPDNQRREPRYPNEQSAGAKVSGDFSLRRSLNSIRNYMYVYICWCFTHPKNNKNFREIKCEKCGSYEDLELHHTKYEPEEKVYLKDIKILCAKCHRNDISKRNGNTLRTIFKNKKRYCITTNYEFEY